MKKAYDDLPTVNGHVKIVCHFVVSVAAGGDIVSLKRDRKMVGALDDAHDKHHARIVFFYAIICGVLLAVDTVCSAVFACR